MNSANMGFAPAAGLLRDTSECNCLDALRLRWLLHQGISSKSIVGPWAVMGGTVIFDNDPNRYRPLVTGDKALIFVVLDKPYTEAAELNPIDMVAWSPRSRLIGTRLGVAFAVGEEQIGIDGLGTTGLPIPVHRSPLGWLRANRHGIVVADWEHAAYALRGLLLSAEDEPHRRELQQRLGVMQPTIIAADRRAAA